MVEPIHPRLSAHLRHDDGLIDTAFFNKVSWGAVFAGVAVALAAQFLLNLLGVGVGAAVIDPATSDNPTATTFSLASAGWFIAAGIIAAFIGGYFASRLSGRPSKSTGGYHGLTSWAVTTLVLIYLLTTSIGAIVGGAFSGLGSVLSGAGQTALTAASTAVPAISNVSNPMSAIEQQIRSATGGNDPQALRDAAVAAVRAAVTGNQAQAEDARNQASQALAKAQSIPVEQAKAEVVQYEAQYKASLETAKQNAVIAAQATSKAVSTGAIVAFFALLLGAFAAWIGGFVGTKR